MKSLAILGATGSIGRNTLKIAAKFPDHFTVKALAAKHNVELLAEQIRSFAPEVVAVFDAVSADRLKKLLPPRCTVEILWGEEGYRRLATWPGVHMVVACHGRGRRTGAHPGGHRSRQGCGPGQQGNPGHGRCHRHGRRGAQGGAPAARGQRAQRHFSMPSGTASPRRWIGSS